MLDRKHLIQGFDALCRASAHDYFVDGHKGGALISATYFLRDAGPEKAVGALLAKKIKAAWGTNKLFAPFPEEDPDPALIQQVTRRLQAQCRTLRQAAHNWILASLALRVLDEIPALATPTRMRGLEALIDEFDTATPVPRKERVLVPDPAKRSAYAAFILEEFIATTARFDGRGQGWSGHLCTFGRALMDLEQHGHGDMIGEGRAVMELYVRRVRMGPSKTDKPRREKSKDIPSPLELAYWERARINFGLGHALKYPYGFFGLLRELDDKALAARALSTFWRISS
jgi:hypothetical protein